MDKEIIDNLDFITPEIIEEQEENQDHESSFSIAERKFPSKLYLLISENKPVFPGMIFPLIFQQGKDADLIHFVSEKMEEKYLGMVLIKSQEDNSEDLTKIQLYRIGTVVRILKVQVNEEGITQVLLRCEARFKMTEALYKQERYEALVVYPEEILDKKDEEIKALGLAILTTMRELMKQNSLFSEEMKMILSRTDWSDPSRLADFAAMTTSSPREELQQILEMFDIKQRLNKVLFILRQESDINALKERITHQIEERINKQQRDFFLREQLKVIKQELGLEKDEKDEEVKKHQERLDKLQVSEEVRKNIQEEIEKLKILSSQSPEYGVCRTYLDWLTGMPWNTITTDRLDVNYGREILNRDHYGLKDVKERILEFIAVAKLKGTIEGSILCLIGPPGVGKTSIGKAIAEALGRKFYRFSLGGMRDEAEIKGHRRTYIGAMPGKFIQAIKTCQTKNPVIMLDEIDKIGASFQGDPASALLEVLDPEQNASFRDHYLDLPFDLSNVLFIATANVADTIPEPLWDRMEIIRLSGYILDEKLQIAKRYLIPKLLIKNGLTKKNIHFLDSALQTIINHYAREAGVRSLEKKINTCVRKVATLIAENKIEGQYVVKTTNVVDLLGQKIFEDDPLMKQKIPGVAMGLAWTAYGGSTLYIETVALPGKGGFKITGQIGAVMNESSQIAYSFILSNLNKFGIKQTKIEEQTLHIHIPAGATPKDGPSAGVTLITSMLSLLLKKTVPKKIAMTGEVTLTGRVLAVGGIKEKVIAAARAKVEKIYLPNVNKKDFEEISSEVRKGITPVYVECYQQIFDEIFK